MATKAALFRDATSKAKPIALLPPGDPSMPTTTRRALGVGPLPDDHDRARGVWADVLTHRTEQQPGHGTLPSRPDHDHQRVLTGGQQRGSARRVDNLEGERHSR